MDRTKQKIGKLGEQLASHWLEAKGFTIVERNRRMGRLEIDIIARKDDILHFIEVKTRRSLRFGHPEDQVDRQKLMNLIDAACGYLETQPLWRKISFDILAVSLYPGRQAEYLLIEDVYM